MTTEEPRRDRIAAWTKVSVVIVEPWHCPELGRSFNPGALVRLPIPVYRRWRQVGAYFKRRMRAFTTPSGRVYWGVVSRCGKPLVAWPWKVQPVEEWVPVVAPTPEEPVPRQVVGPPRGVRPCGCGMRDLERMAAASARAVENARARAAAAAKQATT
jgi:hypothetical protein